MNSSNKYSARNQLQYLIRHLIFFALLSCGLIFIFALRANAQITPGDPGNFITTWTTDNPGDSNDDQISIPITGTGYDFTVDWGDGSTTGWEDGDDVNELTHTYASAGTYTVEIAGDFPRIYFNFGGDKDKILTIEQWGDVVWSSMDNAFAGATNLTLYTLDAPDLSSVIGMNNMFRGATSFKLEEGATINNWEVGNVTNMNFMFQDALIFNQDLSGWDVSKVEKFDGTFLGVKALNSDISGWTTGAAATMKMMFLNVWVINGDSFGCPPPEGGNQRILVGNGQVYEFSWSDFGDMNEDYFIVLKSPTDKGLLDVDNESVVNEIPKIDFDDGLVTWDPPLDEYGYNFTSFEFSIVDDNDVESDETYIMIIDLADQSVELTGAEGWRFLTSPSNGDSFYDFLEDLWTKGVPCSDSPGALFANVNLLSQEQYQWVPPSNLNDTSEPGQPFIVYVYSDDDNDGTAEGFPKILTSRNNWLPLDGKFVFNGLGYNESEENPNNFYLIANPHPIAIDFCDMIDKESVDLSNSVAIWDP